MKLNGVDQARPMSLRRSVPEVRFRADPAHDPKERRLLPMDFPSRLMARSCSTPDIVAYPGESSPSGIRDKSSCFSCMVHLCCLHMAGGGLF